MKTWSNELLYCYAKTLNITNKLRNLQWSSQYNYVYSKLKFFSLNLELWFDWIKKLNKISNYDSSLNRWALSSPGQ